MGFDDLGEHALKNIPGPIHVIAIRGAGAAPPTASAQSSKQRLSVVSPVTAFSFKGKPPARTHLRSLARDLSEALSSARPRMGRYPLSQ
jgi:hypothetical protein